jgi:Ca-activated chloride channel homolog
VITRIFNGAERPVPPMRICCFMTDGYVGDDENIIAAVKRNAKTTRVFSFGIGNSVNRYLLDGMAKAGRGEVEYVLLQSDAEAAAKRFEQRIQTPVLTDIELTFSNGLKVTDLIPGTLPDLFDVKPLIIHGRYAQAGRGTLTIRGRTASGRYERTIALELPANQPEHDTIATLWARAKVEELMNQDLAAAQQGNFPPALQKEVVRLGEEYGIMTQFTSFVAVEKQRVTIGGQPRLVHVPIEMPQGVSYEGVFGGEALFRLMARSDSGRGARGRFSGWDFAYDKDQSKTKSESLGEEWRLLYSGGKDGIYGSDASV